MIVDTLNYLYTKITIINLFLCVYYLSLHEKLWVQIKKEFSFSLIIRIDQPICDFFRQSLNLL